MCKTKNFYIHDFDAIFSDKHCRLSWSLMSSTSTQTISNNKISNPIVIKKTHRNMWTNDKSTTFSDQINIDEVNNIKENLANKNTDIDYILDKIEKLFKNTANTVLGYEKKYQVDTNAKRKPIKFDRKTLNIRNKYYEARREKDGTQEKQAALTVKSKEYKKAVSKALALHRKQTIKKLRNAKTKNPKFYWSAINRQSNNNTNRSNTAISSNDFLSGFKSLSGTNSHGEFTKDKNENIGSTAINRKCKELAEKILNSKITVEEIYLRVKELKNGKACGTDNILNEFIKATFSIMKHVYVDLFNRVLNSGQIPESWTIGMIMPIYKNKGDKGDFDNYRGITILSCLGKLFTSVINARLNKYSN